MITTISIRTILNTVDKAFESNAIEIVRIVIVLSQALSTILRQYPTDFTDDLQLELESLLENFRNQTFEGNGSVLDVVTLMLENRVISSFPVVYGLPILKD